MSTATLIEKLTGRRRAAEQKTLDTYRDLVIAVADDESSVDAARADAILLDSAVSPAKLATDVAELRQRRVDAELAATLPKLQERCDDLAKSQLSLREAQREAERRFNADWFKAQSESAAAENERRAAEAAAARLRAGRPDPREGELRAERGRILQRRAALKFEIGENEASALRGQLASLRLGLKYLKHGPQGSLADGGYEKHLMPRLEAGMPYDETTLRQGIDVTEMRLRGCETELKTLDARLAEIDGTLAAIDRNQMTP